MRCRCWVDFRLEGEVAASDACEAMARFYGRAEQHLWDHIVCRCGEDAGRGRGRVYLVNAFSPSMLPLGPGSVARLSIARVEPGEARRLLEGGFECAIGHESTARLAGELLGVDTSGCRRAQVTLEPGDRLVIVTLTFRPPEGRVYSYEELRRLHEEGKVAVWVARLEE